MIEFYEHKSRLAPRFFYRNFIELVSKSDLSHDEIVNIFEKEVNNKSTKDYFGFTWNLPDYFINHFDESIVKSFNKILKKKAEKTPRILKNCIYPFVSDEFTINSDFYKNILSDRKLLLSENEKFFTIGSCFANNFALFLRSKNIPVINFTQFEDLNSLGSNYILFNYLIKDKKNLAENLKSDYDRLFPEENEASREKAANYKVNQILDIRKAISLADNVIFTLGNIVDFYYPDNSLIPKFLLLRDANANETRKIIAKKLNSLNSNIRLSTFSECQNYLIKIISSIRHINKNCKILLSVSPVPIKSTIGMINELNFSALEIDCVSKSTLRSLLHEVLLNISITDKDIYYLPAFEIVKWIAPNTNTKAFGEEDASSEHVSNILINSICDYIYSSYIKKNN